MYGAAQRAESFGAQGFDRCIGLRYKKRERIRYVYCPP